MRRSNYTFSAKPSIRIPRSKFDLSYEYTSTTSLGRLIPCYMQEVIAGDTFNINTKCVIRTSSNFVKPIFGNLWADMLYFFIPYRLCYRDTERVFGNPNPSQYQNDSLKSFPVLKKTQDSYHYIGEKTVADYFGLPIFANNGNFKYTGVLSALPFRAFALIYNEWFRDENNIDEVFVQRGDIADSERLNINDWSPNNYTGKCPNVAKKHDIFTSCLPNTQKGKEIEFNLASGIIPVTTGDLHSTTDPIRFGKSGDLNNVLNYDSLNENQLYLSPSATGDFVNSTNLAVDTNNLGAVSVNDLRYAVQLQKLLERDARGGTRFNEILLSHYGVSAPDGRLQLTEFLGGKSFPIQIQQVVNTAVNSAEDNLGQLGAYSLSGGQARVNKGFVEPGLIIGVMCLRQQHYYQQGVDKFWTRTKRLDFYDPVFATIGEQPIYATELYAGAPAERVFGYNEAWIHYRTRTAQITGEMRDSATNSLGVWQIADNYGNIPTLSKSFIEETPTYLNKVLANDVQDQFIIDMWHDVKAIRPLPTYSTPSLLDHH